MAAEVAELPERLAVPDRQLAGGGPGVDPEPPVPGGRGQVLPVGAEGQAGHRGPVGREGGQLGVAEPLEVVPLPAAAVRAAVRRQALVEELLGPAHVVRLPLAPGQCDAAVIELELRQPALLVLQPAGLGLALPRGLGGEVAPGDPGGAGGEDDRQGRQQAGRDGVAPAPPPPLPERADPAGPDRLAGPEPAEVLGQLQGAGVALPGLLREALQTDRLQVGGNPGLQPAGRHRLLVQHLHDRLHRRDALERRAAGQQLVEDRAQGVDVRGRADRLALAPGLLGRHVVGRPEDLTGLRLARLAEPLGEPEVGDLGDGSRGSGVGSRGRRRCALRFRPES